MERHRIARKWDKSQSLPRTKIHRCRRSHWHDRCNETKLLFIMLGNQSNRICPIFSSHPAAEPRAASVSEQRLLIRFTFQCGRLLLLFMARNENKIHENRSLIARKSSSTSSHFVLTVSLWKTFATVSWRRGAGRKISRMFSVFICCNYHGSNWINSPAQTVHLFVWSSPCLDLSTSKPESVFSFVLALPQFESFERTFSRHFFRSFARFCDKIHTQNQHPFLVHTKPNRKWIPRAGNEHKLRSWSADKMDEVKWRFSLMRNTKKTSKRSKQWINARYSAHYAKHSAHTLLRRSAFTTKSKKNYHFYARITLSGCACRFFSVHSFRFQRECHCPQHNISPVFRALHLCAVALWCVLIKLD